MPSVLLSPPSPGESPLPQRRVCFSLAAYSKSIIEHLRFTGVTIASGLTDTDIFNLESSLNIEIPPDLRSILNEGVPFGPGFPNWSHSPPPPLIARNGAPPLVRVYKEFYVPSSSSPGNPVFKVLYGGDRVSLAGFDLADFFKREGFFCEGGGGGLRFPVAAWISSSPRKVPVWSELAEKKREGEELEELFIEVKGKLREGGWKEEDVREMTIMMDGGDFGDVDDRTVMDDAGSLLREAGWSEEEVKECMGVCSVDDDQSREKHELWDRDRYITFEEL